MIESDFGRRLKQIRLKRDMSLRDLGERCGLSYSFIASLEKARFKPSRDSIYHLADALETDANELLRLAGFLPDVEHESYKTEDKMPMEVHEQKSSLIPNQKIAPIVAEIACGDPLYTEDSILGYFAVNPIFANVNDGPYVWVKAKGESMINVRIFDGSLVLLHIQPTVDSGDIAAVCVDEETATLKRVYFLADGIMLSPENPNMAPMKYSPERVRIVGKAISVVSEL